MFNLLKVTLMWMGILFGLIFGLEVLASVLQSYGYNPFM